MAYTRAKKMVPMPSRATPLVSAIDQDPNKRVTDADIRALGIDPARARRFFQKTYGMTFQAYCRGRRLGRALQQIRRGTNIDDVARNTSRADSRNLPSHSNSRAASFRGGHGKHC